ncbi:hypothetical protein MHSWG343_10100 [Candidatus Mycoplasma haematohominis]|uniref:Uncharacterized protein n=1 Tax=Candidatus Mycoplasma haematohominis TaxID=1494318 RepID=A0A478FRF1_9MOLU|nr:hypothetical protein MHSWG343_10100 [Candidatus Mycoplasma haemohominis]
MAIVKAAVITGGLVIVGGGGGYYISTLFGEPNPKVCIEKPLTGKFGEDFQYHFMDASDNRNDPWWEVRLEHLRDIGNNRSGEEEFQEEKFLSQEFRNDIIKDLEALKNACKSAYEKTSKEIHFSEEVGSDDAEKQNKPKYEQNIWTFCSLAGQKPKLVYEEGVESEYKGNTGKLGENKKKSLVSIKSFDNKEFWEIQAKSFFSWNISFQANSPFKNLHEKPNASEKTVDAFKKVCEDKYKSSDVNDLETLKFCSLQGKTGS